MSSKIEISLFESVSSVDNPRYVDLYKFLNGIRFGHWQDDVLKLRTLKSKEEKDRQKRKMPTASMSGRFSFRRDDSLISHNGILAIDIDDIDNVADQRDVLAKDPYTLSCYISPSANGLRLLIKIDPKYHRESFYDFSSYLYTNYKIPVDPNGVNVSKPYVVSYDPDCYINQDFENIPIFERVKKKKSVRPKIINKFVFIKKDLLAVVDEITRRGIDLCDTYEEWINIGFALSSELGESGRDIFHRLSSVSGKYSERNTDKQYNYILKSRGDGVNISTLFFAAKQAGIKIISEESRTVIKTTKSGKKAGLNEKQIIDNLKKFEGIEGYDETVKHVFNHVIEDIDDDSYIPELEMFISNNYSIRKNVVNGFFEDCGIIMTEDDINSLYIAAKKRISKLDFKVLKRLLKSDFIKTYNPILDFFGSDGIPVKLPATPIEQDMKRFPTPLIDEISDSIITEDKEYTRKFVRKWIVSIVSAAHYVHSPLLLALIGRKGTGKTEFFRRLLPDELKKYYAESSLDRGKDDELLMTENLIIMDDELSGKSYTDDKKFKKMSSKETFSLRRPYGDHNETIPRMAVLCGTSNTPDILTDTDGNRRVIPIEVLNINREKFNKVDKKDLFKEAYNLYRRGFDWRIISEGDINHLSENEQDFKVANREEEFVRKYFANPDKFPELREDRMYTSEIASEIEIITKSRLNVRKLGAVLKSLGFEKKSTALPEGACKLWRMVRINRAGIDYSFTSIRREYENDIEKREKRNAEIRDRIQKEKAKEMEDKSIELAFESEKQRRIEDGTYDEDEEAPF